MEIQDRSQTLSPNIHYKTQNKEASNNFINKISSNNSEVVNQNEVEFSYKNVNAMSLEDIENTYESNEEGNLLKFLKASTMFSSNLSMNEALFNAVLGQTDVSSSQTYLYNMMSNRNTYLSNSNDGGAWLRQNLISQLDGEVQAEQIKLEKEFLYSMVQFDVAAHMSDMMNFSKKGRDDNKDNYGLFSMYDNTYLQYQSLFNEYESLESGNKNLLNQHLNSAKLMALNF